MCVDVCVNMCDCFFVGQVTIWPTLKSNYKPKNVAGISITIVDLAPVIVAATTVNSTHIYSYIHYIQVEFYRDSW